MKRRNHDITGENNVTDNEIQIKKTTLKPETSVTINT